jgi:hypothetical protein
MKKIFVLLLVALGLFLFGCTQQAPQVQYICSDGKTVVADLSLCPAATASPTPATQAAATPTVTPAISLETELEVCLGMPTTQQTSFEEDCISGLAAKHNDATLCKKLSYEGKRTCYLLVAITANNVSVCEEAGKEKDNCYQQYASNANNASACDKITEINNRDSCYSSIASRLGDATLCDKIRSIGQKNSCYFGIAMNLRDSAYCNKITEDSQKQNCLQNLQQGQQIAVPKG